MAEPKIWYFDNNATTRIAPEVMEAMLPFLREHYGNPSSAHQVGRRVQGHVEEARAKVAALIHAEPREVVFTSCGTESNNTALYSALSKQPQKRHVVMTSVEHSANLNYGKHLQSQGYEITLLPVNAQGQLDLCALDDAIRPDTAIVSVMWANNETGVVFPVSEIAQLCRLKGAFFHTDAVQAAGKLKIDVAGIVGLGCAAELALGRIGEEDTRIRGLRDRFERTLSRTVLEVTRNGAVEPRLPNTSNLAFDGLVADEILMLLDQKGICASGGSACLSGAMEPSHVLAAMGLSPSRIKGSVRFSFGYYNTDAEVDYLLEQLPLVIRKLRRLAAADRILV